MKRGAVLFWIYFLTLFHLVLLMPMPKTPAEARQHYLTNLKRIPSLLQEPKPRSLWKEHKQLAYGVLLLMADGALLYYWLRRREAVLNPTSRCP